MAMSPGRVAVVGSANLDLVTICDTLPRPGETLLARSYREGPGGKGSNQAHAAARMGAEVSFVGLRGPDPAGQTLADALTAEGVDVTGFVVAEGPTGRALVMVDAAAENSIIVVQGTNAMLTAEQVRAVPAVAAASVVVCQLEVPLAAVQAAREVCTGTFVLNPAPAQPLPPDLLAATDVLVVNETEYQTVLGAPLPDDLDEIRTVAARPGAPTTIVATLGERGAAVCHEGVVTLVPAPAVEVVDTTGAGDTFVGALAAELAAGSQTLQAARRAVVAASLSTRRLGATAAMPRRSEVLAAVPTTPGDAPGDQQAAPAVEA